VALTVPLRRGLHPPAQLAVLWDDRSVIADNAALDHPIPLKSFVTRSYYDFASEESWRPMGTMGHVALVRLLGKSPAALRAADLLLHGVNAWLLARLVIGLGLGPETGTWASALFLIHAAHTETLECTAFIEEILVSLGLMTMLLLHRRGRPIAGGRRIHLRCAIQGNRRDRHSARAFQ